jgi:phage terminase large subunit
MGVQPGFNGQKENVQYIHTSYLDNRENLSDKFIIKAEKLKVNKPEKYNHIMMGSWVESAEGVIFTDWKLGEFDTSLPFGYGMDFGFFPDPDVLVKVAVDNKRKCIYVKEMFQLNNAGLNELYSKISQNKSDDKLIYADSAEPRLINDLHGKGVNVAKVRKGSGSILTGIKLMQDYTIIVDPESTNIVRELNHYVWNDKKGGVPVDAYNHWIDAIRYHCIMNISDYSKMDIR